MEIDDFLVKKNNVRFGDWQQTINNDAVAKALTGVTAHFLTYCHAKRDT
jgi:hypothetical protein